VPLTVSEKLQNQITHLCRRCPHVEWSGVLFYTTEGEFGMDDFKVNAEELMLMDIGTSGYTEYDFGPDFVRRIMAKPHLLKMKKGHIHSHNTMSVFFSGTDDGELLENSAHHNIYVSLIVNNHNDMTAKIAFEAVQEAVSIKFKDENGNEKSRAVEGTESIVVFAYPCEIIKPKTSGTEELDEEVEEILASKERSRGTSAFSGFSSEKSQGSFFEEGSWKEEKTKKRYTSSTEKSEKKGTNAIRKKTPQANGKRVQKGFTEKRLYSFTIGMLTRQYAVEDGQRLTDVLQDLQDSYDSLHTSKFQKYLDDFVAVSSEYYEYYYPEDRNYLNFDETMSDVQTLIESFSGKFPELTDRLVEALDIVWEVDEIEETEEQEEEKEDEYPKTVSYQRPGTGYSTEGFDNTDEFPV
jgi:hypothetical protein